jgi:ATP-dependent exoDNAse (exonuclease V) alpha subunit
VSDLNERELAQLPDDSYFFTAADKEKIPGKSAELARSCLAAEKLELKVGAQVMLIKNWHEKGLVNGSQGVVIDFVTEEQVLYPLVKFTDGRELVIEEHTWEKIEGYDAKNKPIVSATRTQIPLILA